MKSHYDKTSHPFHESAYSINGLRIFFSLIIIILCLSRKISVLFFTAQGRSHRLLGAAHLFWLILGTICVIQPRTENEDLWKTKCLLYDIVLGILGIVTTVTAARDFPHRRISNRDGESGTLSNSAIVTQSEMIEHSFYQGLNLWQAMFLHLVTWAGPEDLRHSTTGKLLSMLMVTLPWGVRKMFPVNSFSANWTIQTKEKSDKQDTTKSAKVRVGTVIGTKELKIVNRMYQIKKWQYIFYKHVILHGLNISVAFPHEEFVASLQHNDETALPLTSKWRIFWLCLNASYVMEFFMQTLVKRRVLSQQMMMSLQWILMISSSLAAIDAVLNRVRYGVAITSLAMNFSMKNQDIINTMSISAFVALTNQGSI
ncbi:hypothetical protein ACHAXS_004754 [Conticribra weissflogii]